MDIGNENSQEGKVVKALRMRCKVPEGHCDIEKWDPALTLSLILRVFKAPGARAQGLELDQVIFDLLKAKPTKTAEFRNAVLLFLNHQVSLAFYPGQAQTSRMMVANKINALLNGDQSAVSPSVLTQIAVTTVPRTAPKVQARPESPRKTTAKKEPSRKEPAIPNVNPAVANPPAEDERKKVESMSKGTEQAVQTVLDDFMNRFTEENLDSIPVEVLISASEFDGELGRAIHNCYLNKKPRVVMGRNRLLLEALRTGLRSLPDSVTPEEAAGLVILTVQLHVECSQQTEGKTQERSDFITTGVEHIAEMASSLAEDTASDGGEPEEVPESPAQSSQKEEEQFVSLSASSKQNDDEDEEEAGTETYTAEIHPNLPAEPAAPVLLPAEEEDEDEAEQAPVATHSDLTPPAPPVSGNDGVPASPDDHPAMAVERGRALDELEYEIKKNQGLVSAPVKVYKTPCCDRLINLSVMKTVNVTIISKEKNASDALYSCPFGCSELISASKLHASKGTVYSV